MHFASLSSEAGLYVNLIIFSSIALLRAQKNSATTTAQNNYHHHYLWQAALIEKLLLFVVVIIDISSKHTQIQTTHISFPTENKKQKFVGLSSVDFNCMTSVSVVCTSSQLNTPKNSKDCPSRVCL